tara:strand:- start:1215 stop:1610 length:396 start_codon:yes stop_codon:yes gene_type:complete
MNKIKPNSIEAVIYFVLYICAQDEMISEKELEEFSADIPILEKLYFDIYGELITGDLKNTILETANQLINSQSFLSEKVTSLEEKTISNLISDPKLQDIAILASRHAASADGFHVNEKKKYDFWLKNWDMS